MFSDSSLGKCLRIEGAESLCKSSAMDALDGLLADEICEIPDTTTLVLGGDGNEDKVHGCLSSGGYSWCEARQKCIQDWVGSPDGPCDGADTKPLCPLELEFEHHDQAQLASFLNEAVKQFPTIATLHKIGKSAQKRKFSKSGRRSARFLGI